MRLLKQKGIVIFGGMGSGKDTFAEIILNIIKDSSIFNIGCVCRDFMIVSNVNPMWEGKSRELSQIVSVKLREIDENLLNDYVFAKSLETSSFPIIVGGRTLKDFEYWRNKEFLSVGINVEFNERLKRIRKRDSDFNVDSLNHSIEKDSSYIVNELCDVSIDNSLDLESLKKEANSFCTKYIL